MGRRLRSSVRCPWTKLLPPSLLLGEGEGRRWGRVSARSPQEAGDSGRSSPWLRIGTPRGLSSRVALALRLRNPPLGLGWQRMEARGRLPRRDLGCLPLFLRGRIALFSYSRRTSASALGRRALRERRSVVARVRAVPAGIPPAVPARPDPGPRPPPARRLVRGGDVRLGISRIGQPSGSLGTLCGEGLPERIPGGRSLLPARSRGPGLSPASRSADGVPPQ